MKQKDYFTVSEFAKLRGVTPETLRHYDRIGLLKPAFTDPETNYRYYSIFQYEKLGTIKELRQLNLPLDLIKDYFTDRNVKKSMAILDECYQKILKQKEEIEAIEESIKTKIAFLEYSTNMSDFDVVRIREEAERYLIFSGEEVIKEGEMGYEWSMLEKKLDEMSPILGSSRIGYFYEYNPGEKVEDVKKTPFIFKAAKGNIDSKHMKKLDAGKYLDVYVKGINNYQKAYDFLQKEITKNNYRVIGDVITFFPVDITITDEQDESVVEMQVQIEQD